MPRLMYRKASRKTCFNKKDLPQGISINPISSFNQEEMAFLARLYASTRWQEVLQAPWTDKQRHEFLQQQFEAQHKHYQSHYPHSEFLIIQKNNDNIGRLYLDKDKTSICLIDIALLPEQQNTGLGTLLLKKIIKEAKQTNKKIVIHVEKYNPAYHWYLKHGFQQIDDKGVYQYMEWRPQH